MVAQHRTTSSPDRPASKDAVFAGVQLISEGKLEARKIGKRTLFLQIRGQLPAQAVSGYVYEAPAKSITVRPQTQAEVRPEINLDTLNAGDPKLQLAIARARRIIGRDIPILIQGESGAGLGWSIGEASSHGHGHGGTAD